MIEFKGTRWFKCDFHLHTTKSKCFHDQTVTPEQWVDRAIEQGLDCVAVTDHNSGLGVDEIKEAANNKGLIVYPGVEITCDTGKVHLLVIFDVDKTAADIRDFLVRAEIEAKDFGEQTGYTLKSVFDIAELAKGKAIIIPSHIDSFSGLSSLSLSALNDFYALENINGVQIVHEEFLDTTLDISNNSELVEKLSTFYGNSASPIGTEELKARYSTVQNAIKKNIAILTFSDNPHAPMSPKHGLAGIGDSYTWIKMNETPSLESLRQALLLPEYRVKNKIQSPNPPYKKPSIWIKSISISNTKITDPQTPLKVEFSPQLNTIIGGRGSGKSSVIRFIRGVFNRSIDENGIESLLSIINDQNDFYKIEGGRPKKGVIDKKTVIEIEIIRNEESYRVTASLITSSCNQNIKIEKLDALTSKWVRNNDEGFINFFEFEQYSQKQIYEIAQEPNALREKIDTAIDEVSTIKAEKDKIKINFLAKSAEIRAINQLIKGKGLVETKINDLDESIKKLQKSGVAKLIEDKEKFLKEKKNLITFKESITSKEELINSLIEDMIITEIDYSDFNDEHSKILKPLSDEIIQKYTKIKDELEQIKTSMLTSNTNYNQLVKDSTWNTDFAENLSELATKKLELEADGIEDISNYEKLTDEREILLEQLALIKAAMKEGKQFFQEKKVLKEQYLDKRKELTSLREQFVKSLFENDNKLKISINQFRNKNDFENKLRQILQKQDTFQDDINILVDICFRGKVEDKIKEIKKIFLDIRQDLDVNKIVSGGFINIIKNLNSEQIDEIELLIPEDEIEIKYKPNNQSPFKSLSTASAGQKTTAILTFLLSYGKNPLILDQPEDDLDNKLVYDLIVDRLKKAKEKRQLIVVTHNANIPVNGDAEYIISMNSETKKLSVLHSGTVEQQNVKKEICDVMEGSESAFEMRSRRYKQV
jgi:energy-coupling factor transporter ATP-binding protein EcfA2